MANPRPIPHWKPGQSGNPAGRPKKGDSAADMIRDILEDKDRKRLRNIVVALVEKAEEGEVKPAALLFERGYGKAIAKVEVSVPDMTVAELMQTIINVGETPEEGGSGTPDGAGRPT